MVRHRWISQDGKACLLVGSAETHVKHDPGLANPCRAQSPGDSTSSVIYRPIHRQVLANVGVWGTDPSPPHHQARKRSALARARKGC